MHMTAPETSAAPSVGTHEDRRNRLRRKGLLIAAVASMLASSFGAGGVAHAAPAIVQVDPVQGLIDAGVPAEVARHAVVARPAEAAEVVSIAHPGQQFSFPGTSVDALIDHANGKVTVVQRWLSGPSGLSVGWINLSNRKSGITGLPDLVPQPDDIHYGSTYADRAATISTGQGNVALVVWGRIPGWTGLIPLAPEYFGILTPSGAFVHV